MVRKSDSLRQKIAPLSVVRGQQVTATYTEQEIPEYQGNPLIEAMPPLWTMEEVEQMLSYFPHYDPKQRKLASEIRIHLLENAREFFVPQGIHYEIHLSISNMIRRGYIDRNPVLRGVWTGQSGKVEQLADRLQRRAFLRSKARGMSIVGIGGVGKSTAVENILSFYPQVITHTRYKDGDLILKQLVWVKLQCPNDGSLRGMCIGYLQEVDDLLGTNYMSHYSALRRTIDELLLIMARVASNHFQGVIVFDEIQDLSEAKSGGATRMLNFFVQLENTLGIPFILIGTPKAKDLLSGEFRQARRVSEQGDIYWHPMREIAVKERTDEPDKIDPDWNVFVRAMWKYWYLKKDHPLPDNLLEEPVVRTMYEASKGITALVVTIFFLAQRRAIVSGKENLTEGVIRSAVKDNQNLVNRVFERVKGNHHVGRSPRAISDLDHSAWQEHAPAEPDQVKGGTRKSTSRSDSKKAATPQPVVGAKPPRPSGKRGKGSKSAQAFEEGDFRALSAQPDEVAPIGERPLSSNLFGSTDEFS
jgi:hypothetical protein